MNLVHWVRDAPALPQPPPVEASLDIPPNLEGELLARADQAVERAKSTIEVRRGHRGGRPCRMGPKSGSNGGKGPPRAPLHLPGASALVPEAVKEEEL